MAEKTLLARVKQRSDTVVNWTAKNPVIGDGELIVVITSASERRFKVGDGEKAFTQLPYADEQIFNNVVTSINGKTGAVTIDGIPINWRGEYNSSTVYNKNDVVSSNGSSYIMVSKSSASGTIPGIDDEVWELMVQKGDKGEKGNPGVPGAKGDSGVVSASVPLVYNNNNKSLSISAATANSAGTLSAVDKKKLDGVAVGANKTIVDATLNSTSVNPVQNKAIYAELGKKVNKLNPVFKGSVTIGVDSSTDNIQLDVGGFDDDNALLQLSSGIYSAVVIGGLADIGDAEALGIGDTAVCYSQMKNYVDGKVAAVADHVIAQGTSDPWTWRKWASGIAEMWGLFGTDKLEISTAWGSMYYGTWMNLAQNIAGRKYPFAFIQQPIVTVTYSSGNGDAWPISSFKSSDNLLTSAPAYALARPTVATLIHPRISYHVVGRYKQ